MGTNDYDDSYPLAAICFYCDNDLVHLLGTLTVLLITGFFLMPLTLLFWVQIKNFLSG